MPAIGPEMPSERRRRRSRSDSVSSRSSYDSSSSRSSSSSRRRSPSPSGSETSARRRPAVAGPQLPANFLRSRSRSDSASSSHLKASSSDEEGPCVGPALPTASNTDNDGLNAGARAFLEREARKNAAAQEAKLAAEKAANSRPEWMLLPPSLSNASSLQAVAGDPLNLKSRGFAQSTPRVSARGGGGGGGEDADMSLWTETPEERMKRMQDEVSGVRSKDGAELSEKEALERDMTARRDASIAASVAEGRGKKSLVEEHNERRKREMQEKLEDEAREKRRRRDEEEEDDSPRHRRHRSRSPDRKVRDRHGSSSSHRHRSSRQSDSHRSHSSRHRPQRHSDGSDDKERHRERRKRKESERRRDKDRERRSDKDKDKDKDKERKKSRKEREEQNVREGKMAAPMIWDREAALSIGGRLIDEKKRGKMIADANALGDRFGSGSRRFL